MMAKILKTILISLAVAALPVIFCSIMFGGVTVINAVISISVPAGLYNFFEDRGKKQLPGEMIATFITAAFLCLFLQTIGI